MTCNQPVETRRSALRGEGHLVYGVTVAAQEPCQADAVRGRALVSTPRVAPALHAPSRTCPQVAPSSVMFVLKNKETLRALVDAVIGTLSKVIEGWF